jgi:hypothetical protein
MQANVPILAHLFWFVFAMVSLLVVWQFAFVPTMNASFRARVFEIRRELFLYMADGNISPNEKAYTHLRSNMNAALRFSERISLVRLLIGGLLVRSQVGDRQSELAAATASVSPEVRDRLCKFDQDLGEALAVHVIFVSPSAWALVLFFVLGAIVYALMHGMRALSSAVCVPVRQKLVEVVATLERDHFPSRQAAF